MPATQTDAESITPHRDPRLIFGREPAVYGGLVEVVLTLMLVFGVDGLSKQSIGLIMAVVSAALGLYTAWVTKDTLLGVAIGLLKAAFALLAGYGLELTQDQTGAIIAAVAVLLSVFQRTQTSPLAAPSMRTGLSPGGS